MSFWFKLLTLPANEAGVASFEAMSGVPIELTVQLKELVWRSNNLTAPSKPTDGTVSQQVWYCVSLYLTSVHMDINYISEAAPADVRTWVIDDQPTTSIDDMWQNQPEANRKIRGLPSFGSDPTSPSEMLLDDVRIVRGKSNVCGI